MSSEFVGGIFEAVDAAHLAIHRAQAYGEVSAAVNHLAWIELARLSLADRRATSHLDIDMPGTGYLRLRPCMRAALLNAA